MTTDDFTKAARKRAEQIVPLDGGEPNLIFRDRRELVEMAEWARTHLAAQEPTDAEKAVRELHRPAQVYTLAEDCTESESHEWSTASHGGDELCLNEPTGQQFCTECCPEDAFDCTDYPYPCATIQALDAARATRRDEEKR
ncbi:hypothetical protein [Brachybacterium paraconglomeratum]|uniref:hypothetical protein n=1 Tax=Brachybacterium paraconglomeratum TaxID=173362 RepID=UPI0022B00159|nr:hypothetical protein [Brachybacterium paraconglomeratum]MCZ4325700.1 hypothetical protein [Brachybacterium paraconglomeratum]